MICSSRSERLVNHCFTTRTSCTGRTGRGLVFTPSPSNDMQFPQTVRLVNHCLTTRTSCTGRTGRTSCTGSGLVYTPKYISALSLSNDMQFTN